MKRFISIILAVVLCISSIGASANISDNISREEGLARELKELGLFKGVSDTEFELNRAPSRVEAIVMLIRVLGKENEALAGEWSHPFSDVPAWADNYVGYAYSCGLTKGEDADKFGEGDANAAMYLTFVLRALGYSDTNGEDFNWENPFTLSGKLGILPDSVNVNEFLRSDVVIVSHAALSAHIKNSSQTLAQKLISANVFSQADFERIYSGGKNVALPAERKEMTAEEIYEMCSPAVFYITVYDYDGVPFATGSGFFIDDKGTAVTNYHVLDNSFSATAQMSDTQEIYNIVGIYDYSEEYDWAVIQVDRTGNKYLSIGDVSQIKGGETIYTIGSPEGLQNTISDGLISNPKREFSDTDQIFIQISAPISHGSSGGALLNKYGEVLGITSSGFDENDAQNLNLVIPITDVTGFKRGEINKFENVFFWHTIELEEALKTEDREKIAYALLKWIIVNEHQSKDPEKGYVYKVIREKYGGMAYQGITLAYKPEEDVFTATIVDMLSGIMAMEYSFDIKKGATESTGTFVVYEYAEGDYSSVWTGKAKVPVKSFSADFGYKFEETEGEFEETQEILEESAKSMHATMLSYIEMQFGVFEEVLGLYTATDLGYAEFNGGADENKVTENKANITYKLNTKGVSVEVGQTATIEMDYITSGFPAEVDFYVASESKRIAIVDWVPEDETLPWGINITGVSEGTTQLTISNSFNDQTVSIPIKVTNVEDEQDEMYSRIAMAAFPLRLYSNNGTVYLGKLTENARDEEGILNPYCKYGSQTSSYSIFNPLCKYGSRRSDESAFCEYAEKPPVIVDNDGKFIAYLTNNPNIRDGLEYRKLLMYLKTFRL